MAFLHSIRSRPAILAAGGAALLAIGGGAGALAVAATRPSVTMAPATPVAIRTLPASADDAIVTIRGQVVEVYGNKFVMADASGRMLVDTGREGEDGGLVTAGRPVTVQGRFDHGFVHAAFLVGSDGAVKALGPLGGGRRHGPGGGPDGDRDGGPGKHRDGPDRAPPPPAAAPAVAAPQAVAPATN